MEKVVDKWLFVSASRVVFVVNRRQTAVFFFFCEFCLEEIADKQLCVSAIGRLFGEDRREKLRVSVSRGISGEGRREVVVSASGGIFFFEEIVDKDLIFS